MFLRKKVRLRTRLVGALLLKRRSSNRRVRCRRCRTLNGTLILIKCRLVCSSGSLLMTCLRLRWFGLNYRFRYRLGNPLVSLSLITLKVSILRYRICLFCLRRTRILALRLPLVRLTIMFYRLLPFLVSVNRFTGMILGVSRCIGRNRLTFRVKFLMRNMLKVGTKCSVSRFGLLCVTWIKKSARFMT